MQSLLFFCRFKSELRLKDGFKSIKSNRKRIRRTKKYAFSSLYPLWNYKNRRKSNLFRFPPIRCQMMSNYPTFCQQFHGAGLSFRPMTNALAAHKHAYAAFCRATSRQVPYLSLGNRCAHIASGEPRFTQSAPRIRRGSSSTYRCSRYAMISSLP